MKPSGGVVFRKCHVCWRDAISAHNGEVTAVGRAEIESVSKEGHIRVRCECGAPVVWQREISQRR